MAPTALDAAAGLDAEVGQGGLGAPFHDIVFHLVQQAPVGTYDAEVIDSGMGENAECVSVKCDLLETRGGGGKESARLELSDDQLPGQDLFLFRHLHADQPWPGVMKAKWKSSVAIPQMRTPAVRISSQSAILAASSHPRISRRPLKISIA